MDSEATMKVCRVCLAMSVKMYHMSEHKLSVMYERVTGVEINTEDKLPRMLCWECVARLSAANLFIVKAFKTHWILMKQQSSSKLVTVSDIESINRVHYKLASTLGFKHSKENDTNLYIIEENDEDNDHFDQIRSVSCELNNVDTSISIKDKQITNMESNFIDENLTFKGDEGSVDQNVPDEDYTEANISGEETKCQNTNSFIQTFIIDNEDNISDEEMTIDNMSNVTDLFEEKQHVLGEATGFFEEIKHSVIVERNLRSEALPPRCKELRVVLEDIMLTLSKYNTQDSLYQLTAQSLKDSSTAHHPQIKEKILKQKINTVEKTTGTSDLKLFKDDSETSKNVFICDICDKGFDIKSTLTRHIMEHSNDGNVFNCDYCDYRSFYKPHLSGHLKSIHAKKKTHKCSHCSYKTYHHSDLSKHINAKHTQNISYNCSYCPYKTHYRHGIFRHINVKHTHMIVYRCPHCIYTSYRTSDVSRHVNAKHTKANVHNCSLCSYKAYKKSDLSAHINGKHSKLISYNCSYCSYKAYHRGNLNKHVNSRHTKADIYYCSLCSYKTYRKSSLIVHVKGQHAGTRAASSAPSC